jgi:hypothetical protein
VTIGPAVPAATSGSSGARRGLPGGAWARAADGGTLLGSVLKAFPLLEERTSSQGLETPGVAGSPVYRAPASVSGTSNSKSRLCVRPGFRREQPRARPAISWRRTSEQAPGLAVRRLRPFRPSGVSAAGGIARLIIDLRLSVVRVGRRFLVALFVVLSGPSSICVPREQPPGDRPSDAAARAAIAVHVWRRDQPGAARDRPRSRSSTSRSSAKSTLVLPTSSLNPSRSLRVRGVRS